MGNQNKTSSGVYIKDSNLRDGVTSGKGLKNKEKPYVPGDKMFSSFGLFKLVLLLGFAFITIRILFNGNSLDFSFIGFLENLKTLPSVSTAFKDFFTSFKILADWGVFNFLRDFINTFVDINAVLCWLGGALIDVLLFISSFLKMLFV